MMLLPYKKTLTKTDIDEMGLILILEKISFSFVFQFVFLL